SARSCRRSRHRYFRERRAPARRVRSCAGEMLAVYLDLAPALRDLRGRMAETGKLLGARRKQLKICKVAIQHRQILDGRNGDSCAGHRVTVRIGDRAQEMLPDTAWPGASGTARK